MEIRPIVRKIELLPLIQMLQMLYDNGLDFVDLNGRLEEGGDVLNLSFGKSYMNPEYIEDFDEFMESDEKPESTENIKITPIDKETLNGLL